MKKRLILLILSPYLTISSHLYSASFENAWVSMQQDYLDIKSSPDYEDSKLLIGDFYTNFRNQVALMIFSPPNKQFLTRSCLSGVMHRTHETFTATYEETFLQYCLSNKTKAKLNLFTNDKNCLMPITCPKFNCSATTLGHLFYTAKILEAIDSNPSVIIEFGGGFGNLTRCLKTIMPDTTIIIIDLPEMCVIQKMYLGYTLPNASIELHKSSNLQIKPREINLVPIHLINHLKVDSDLFVSTFALSEAPNITQSLLANFNFFNAKHIYLTGQIDGWKNLKIDLFTLESHELLLNQVRNKYKTVSVSPFHILSENAKSYELIATNVHPKN